MPINYANYPFDWKQIRQRILSRAGNKCECCGLPNYENVHSFKEDGKTVWRKLDLPLIYQEGIRPVRVVLTIAHLDHDEHNFDVKDDRLMAMCQLCHLRYDAPEKSRRRKLKNNSK